MAVRILIADDHNVVRAGFAALLRASEEPKVVGEASNGAMTVRLACELQPDLVLLDWSMPDMNGAEVMRALRDRAPDVRVLVLTGHKDGVLLEQALQLGAAGYVPKDAQPDDLRTAIMAAMQGDAYVHPSMVGMLAGRLMSRLSPEPNTTDELSEREHEVLQYVALGYTNRQVAEALAISVRTVERHRSSVADKLGLHSRAALVQYARVNKLID